MLEQSWLWTTLYMNCLNTTPKFNWVQTTVVSNLWYFGHWPKCCGPHWLSMMEQLYKKWTWKHCWTSCGSSNNGKMLFIVQPQHYLLAFLFGIIVCTISFKIITTFNILLWFTSNIKLLIFTTLAWNFWSDFMQVRAFLGTDWHRNYDLFKKPDYYVKVPLFSCSPLGSI